MSLKHRKRYMTSVNLHLLEIFREFAETSRINQSKLIDEAIRDLLIKHGIDVDTIIQAAKEKDIKTP